MTEQQEASDLQPKPKRAWKTSGTRPITVRPTDFEHRLLSQRAAAEGRSLSSYLIWAGSRDSTPLSLEDRLALMKLREEMRRVGVNINQLTHALHSSRKGNAQPPTAEDLAGALHSLYELMAAIKAML